MRHHLPFKKELTYHTNSTELGPSCEAASRSAARVSQHFTEAEDLLPHLKENRLVHILSQINPVHTTPSNLFTTHFNIILQP
jgi:hypothetical protein